MQNIKAFSFAAKPEERSTSRGFCRRMPDPMNVKPLSRLSSPRQGGALFLLCWAAYASAYVGRYNYSVLMSAMIADGVLSLSAAGAVSTGYFICYAAGQLGGGLLCQCGSPFTVIFAGLALSGVCNLAMSVVPPAGMAVLWAVNGLLQALLWPSIVRLFAECLPLTQQKSACVNINSAVPAGTFAAYGLCALLLALTSWRTLFIFCGLVLLGMAAFWLPATAPLRRCAAPAPLWCRAAAAQIPPPVAAAGNGAPASAAPTPRGMLLPLLSAGLLRVALPVLLHGGLKDGVTSWVPSMVQNNFSVSPAFSAAVSMALPLVNLGGAYAAGWLDRRVFHNELKTAAALFLLAGVCLTALHAGIAVSVALLALVTAAMLGVNAMFVNVMPVRAGRAGGAALLSGVLNALTYAGSAAVTWGAGAAAGRWGWNAVLMLWLGMAAAAFAVSAGAARRWGRFAAACDRAAGLAQAD